MKPLHDVPFLECSGRVELARARRRTTFRSICGVAPHHCRRQRRLKCSRGCREAVRALSWGEVEAIRDRFRALNPYGDGESILEFEDENYVPCTCGEKHKSVRGCTAERRQLYTYSVASKRYALFNLNTDGDVVLRGIGDGDDTEDGRLHDDEPGAAVRKYSEHGLGAYQAPHDPDTGERIQKWEREVWQILIRRAMGQPLELPAWAHQSSMEQAYPLSVVSNAADGGLKIMSTAYLCKKCGTQFSPRDNPPSLCPICTDDRQYIPPEGQQWTTLEELRADHTNRFLEVESGVTKIVTEPSFGIGQQAYLIETPHGNLLWDCVALIDDATVAEIQRRGGIGGIAISHAHYYSTMVTWSRALGNVPIWLHEANRSWAMYQDDAIEYWNADTMEPLPGITIIRTGGHFPGAMVFHRAGNPNAIEPERRDGVLFSGDIIRVVADPKWVTFMYSYPNTIPLDPVTVRRMADLVAPYPFARIHDAFDKHVLADGSAVVERSAERYIKHILGEAGPTIA